MRALELWKVHGSLDWFQNQDGVVVSLPLHDRHPRGFEPVMVSPGIRKYELRHDEPFRSVLTAADAALQRARACLCIGYGFNDRHIQAVLVRRCHEEDLPIVILARTLTPAARDFLSSGRCGRNFLALERAGEGTRVFEPPHPQGYELPEISVWHLEGFLDHILSGDRSS